MICTIVYILYSTSAHLNLCLNILHTVLSFVQYNMRPAALSKIV